jgi:hypothetical protein
VKTYWPRKVSSSHSISSFNSSAPFLYSEALSTQSLTPTKSEPSPPPKDPVNPVVVEGEPGETEPHEEEVNTGAFNPVTGEINWDCPCLGGMAHGPCGPQFREAFSCFVYSDAEPKGIDCVERFKNMQDCFREHPEVYAEGTSTRSKVEFN